MDQLLTAAKADDEYHYYADLWVTPITLFSFAIGLATALWAVLRMWF